MTVGHIKRELKAHSDPEKAVFLRRFFKTGKGEYAAGDRFIGITVPEIRRIAKPYVVSLSLADCTSLLQSKIHEERLAALVILVAKYARAKDLGSKRQLFMAVKKHIHHVNNWDLVDLCAPKLIGPFIYETGKFELLDTWAQAKNLWLRRIAIIATFAFLRLNHYEPTLEIARQLLQDKEDLIHKAVGWMLREMGKRNPPLLEDFLVHHHSQMPRTMLRYAMEKWPLDKRKPYLLR